MVAFGLGHIKSDALRSWAWIFLVLGLLSVMLGLGWVIFMPDTPLKARFLNEDEQIIALERVAENMTGTKGQDSEYHQLSLKLTEQSNCIKLSTRSRTQCTISPWCTSS